jgi:hypothetical protein
MFGWFVSLGLDSFAQTPKVLRLIHEKNWQKNRYFKKEISAIYIFPKVYCYFLWVHVSSHHSLRCWYAMIEVMRNLVRAAKISLFDSFLFAGWWYEDQSLTKHFRRSLHYTHTHTHAAHSGVEFSTVTECVSNRHSNLMTTVSTPLLRSNKQTVSITFLMW